MQRFRAGVDLDVRCAPAVPVAGGYPDMGGASFASVYQPDGTLYAGAAVTEIGSLLPLVAVRVQVPVADFVEGTWHIMVGSTEPGFNPSFTQAQWGGDYELLCAAAEDVHNRSRLDFTAPAKDQLYAADGTTPLRHWPLKNAAGTTATSKADTYERGAPVED